MCQSICCPLTIWLTHFAAAEGAAGSVGGSQAAGDQLALQVRSQAQVHQHLPSLASEPTILLQLQLEQNATPAAASTSYSAEGGQGRWHGDWTSEWEGSTAIDPVAKQGHEGASVEAESGWGENDLGLEVPEIDLPEGRNGAAAAGPSALPDSEHASPSLPGDPQPSDQAQLVHEAPVGVDGGQLMDLAAGSHSIPADDTPEQQLEDAAAAQASSSVLPNGVTHHIHGLSQPAGGLKPDSLHGSQGGAPLPDEMVNGAVSEDGHTDHDEEDDHADEEDEGDDADQDVTAVLERSPEVQPSRPQGAHLLSSAIRTLASMSPVK